MQTKGLPSKSLQRILCKCAPHVGCLQRRGPALRITCGGHASLMRESWGALTQRARGSHTAQWVRAGEVGNRLSPRSRAHGPSWPGAPAPSDHLPRARVTCRGQDRCATAGSGDLFRVLCSRSCIYTFVCTHAYTYIHRPVHTHTPWPRWS